MTPSINSFYSFQHLKRQCFQLGPTVLDDIHEYGVFSPSPDEGIHEKEASSESVSLNSQDSSTPSDPAPIVQIPKVKSLAPLATAEDSPASTAVPTRHTSPNGNLPLMEKKTTLDMKNNNSTGTKDAYTTPTAIVAPTRPMSKVAPIVNNVRKMATTAVSNKVTKPVTPVSSFLKVAEQRPFVGVKVISSGLEAKASGSYNNCSEEGGDIHCCWNKETAHHGPTEYVKTTLFGNCDIQKRVFLCHLSLPLHPQRCQRSPKHEFSPRRKKRYGFFSLIEPKHFLACLCSEKDFNHEVRVRG